VRRAAVPARHEVEVPRLGWPPSNERDARPSAPPGNALRRKRRSSRACPHYNVTPSVTADGIRKRNLRARRGAANSHQCARGQQPSVSARRGEQPSVRARRGARTASVSARRGEQPSVRGAANSHRCARGQQPSTISARARRCQQHQYAARRMALVRARRGQRPSARAAAARRMASVLAARRTVVTARRVTRSRVSRRCVPRVGQWCLRQSTLPFH
jgi:hypothetical protein